MAILQEELIPIDDRKTPMVDGPRFGSFNLDEGFKKQQSPISTTSDPEDFGAAFDKFLKSPQSVNAKYAPLTFDWKAENADRYVKSPYLKEMGFMPGQDNESRYGYRQTWGNTLNNAFVGAGKLAYNGFVDGWKGYGRMTDALINMDWNKIHGDEQSMMDLNDSMEKNMNDNAIFVTPESEDTFFNRKTLGNFVQQSGFTVGTIAQMAVEQGLTKMVEAALLVPTMGTGTVALEIAEDANTAAKIGRLASILGRTKKFFDAKSAYSKLLKMGDLWKDDAMIGKLMKGIGSKIPGVDIAMDLNKAAKMGASGSQLAYIGAGGIKRLLSESNLAFTEARMEAAGTYADMYNKMTADYMSKFGEMPDGENLAKMRETAKDGANSNFNFNAALLGVMNRIQFDNALKGFKSTSRMGKMFGLGESELVNRTTVKGLDKLTGKEITQTYRKGVMGQLGVTAQIAETFGKKKAAKELGWSMLKSGSKWELTEGIQELLQEGSNNYFQDFYQNRYTTGKTNRGESFDKAIDSQLNMQGFKTFMSGALTGMMISGPTHLFTHGSQNFTKSGRAQTKDRNAKFDTHLNELNGVMKNVSDVYSETIKNFNLQNEVSKELNKSVEVKDKFAFENLKTTALGTLMSTAVRNGTHEGLIDTLKSYDKHFSKEEFEKAFVGLNYTSENKQSVKDYTGKLINSLEEYAKDWENLNDKFGKDYNPDMFIPGSNEQQEAQLNKRAMDDMIEVLAGNRLKAKDSLKRMQSIYAKISSTPGTGGSLAHTFTTMGSEKHTDAEIHILTEELKSLEASPIKPREIVKMIRIKRKQLRTLETWKEKKQGLVNDMVRYDGTEFKEAKEAFTEFVNSRNEEQGNEINISQDESNEHFNAMYDYVRLNKTSQDHTDAYNMLIDPKNFSKLHQKLVWGAKSAGFALQAEAIQEANGKVGFNIENKALFDRMDVLNKKAIKTQEDEKEYFVLLKELHQNAINYGDDKVKLYSDKLYDIIDNNEVFRKDNDELISELLKIMKSIDEKDYSENTLEELTDKFNVAFKKLQVLAYEFLQVNPELMEKKVEQSAVPINITPENISGTALDELKIKLDKLTEQFIKNGKTEKEAENLALNSITEEEKELLRNGYKNNIDAIRKQKAEEEANKDFVAQRTAIDKMTDPEERKTAEIKLVMSLLFSKVGEASGLKIKEYVDRIIAGQPREKVIEGLSPSFIAGIDQLLAVQNQIIVPTITPELQLVIDKLDLALPAAEFSKLIGELVNDNKDNVSFIVALLKKVEQYKIPEIANAFKPGATSAYKPLSTILNHTETFTITIGKNVMEVYKLNDQYFDLYTNELFTIPVGMVPVPNIMDTVGKRTKENIKSTTIESGINLNQSRILKEHITDNPNTPYKVVATTVWVENNQKKLGLIQQTVPKRTLITHETSAQREKLMKGESVLTTFSNTNSFNTIITIPGIQGQVDVYFNDNWAIVHADNSTEVVNFGKDQERFLLDNMLVDNVKITPTQLEELKKAYDRNQSFKIRAQELFLSDSQADITELFKEYFTISTTGLTLSTEKNGLLDDVLNNPSNAKNIVNATIAEIDEFDVIVPGTERPFSFPLMQSWQKSNNTSKWKTIDPLEHSGIKPINERNIIQLVSDGKRHSINSYVEEVLKINPPQEKGNTNHRWLSLSGNVIQMEQKTGTEVGAGFLKMMSALFAEVNASNSIVDTNNQMFKFNRELFAFKPKDGWNADFSLVKHTKQNEGKEEKDKLPADITIEIRPDVVVGGIALNYKIKKIFNIFLPAKDIFKIKNLLRDRTVDDILNSPELMAELNTIYQHLGEHLTNEVNKIDKKLQAELSKPEYDAFVAAYGLPTSHLLTEYLDRKEETDPKIWNIKVQDRKKQSSDTSLYSIVWGDSAVSKQRELRIELTNSSTTQLVKENTADIIESEQKNETVNEIVPTNVNEEGDDSLPFDLLEEYEMDDDEEAPFSLSDEDFVPYSDAQFADEVKKISEMLPDAFKRGELDEIIDQLKAGKPILGYYMDKVMYFSKNLSSRGTGYHEAFHGVFRELMTNEKRDFYIDKALREMGNISKSDLSIFKNERGLKVSDTQAKRLMAEEFLADGFKKFMLNDQEPKQSWFKIFVKLLQRVLSFFTGKSHVIDNLYKDIAGGKFKNVIPIKNSNKQGAFDLGYGRPTMKIVEKDGKKVLQPSKNVINTAVQEEMINRLTFIVSNMKNIPDFNVRFETARAILMDEYDTKQLIAGIPVANREAALNKYQELFYEYQFVLGKAVPYVLSTEVKDLNQTVSTTKPAESAATIELLRQLTKAKIKSLGLEDGWFDKIDDIEFNKDDEDKEMDRQSGKFGKIHINPKEGMSKELRQMFSVIPYSYKDEVTGVKFTKMVDGARVFDAIMKIAANNAPDRIFHVFRAAIDVLKSDDNENYIKMETMFNFFKDKFQLNDNMEPGRNLHFYAQFVEAFFITELPMSQPVLYTNGHSSRLDIIDASIQGDVSKVMDKWKFDYEKDFVRLTLGEKQAKLSKLSDTLDEYFSQDATGVMKNVNVLNYTDTVKVAKKLKKAFDEVGLYMPTNLMVNSLVGIYFIEENNPKPVNKSNSYNLIYAQQQLFKDKAFLQKDFFYQFLKKSIGADINLFEKTIKTVGGVTPKARTVQMVTGIMRKAAKMVVKYDISTAVTVFKTADGESVSRYMKYTPIALISQIVRSEGIEGLTKLYPGMTDWFADAMLSDKTEENELFLKNFEVGLFGGFRQVLNKNERDGKTFGDIDEKALYLSSILLFMDRKIINGQKTSITTFKRSRSQEEATGTNYLVTGLYERLIDDKGNVIDSVNDTLIRNIQQEYNRISKEWADRNTNKQRLENFNGRLDKETGALITDDKKLRAYIFRMQDHFFKTQPAINDQLIEAAMSGKSFEEAMEMNMTEGTMEQNLRAGLDVYMKDSFQKYMEILKTKGILESKTLNGKTFLSSDLIPTTIKLDYKNPTLKNLNYTLESLIKDQWYNIFVNKITTNQLFDGDLGRGVADSVTLYKRNKEAVISGTSLKEGHYKTANISVLKVWINRNDLTQGQYDTWEDIPVHLRGKSEKETPFVQVDVFDGGSFHTMNHLMMMYRKQGRNDDRSVELLKKARYMELSNKELSELEKVKVVMNSKKTATGGIQVYDKLAEELLLRTEISALIIPTGGNRVDIENKLKDLYEQAEELEIRLRMNYAAPEDADAIEFEISKIYSDIHSHWAPLRSRSQLHYLLNSMEMSGIDQVFDSNSSKKSRAVPVKLNKNGITDLKLSRTDKPGLFKFIQLETSGIHYTITNPTQVRQMITTYLNHTGDADLIALAKSYSETLGEIAKSATDKVNRILKDVNGNLDVNNLFESMRRDLTEQGADSNTLKMLEIRDGKPVHNLNLPFIKKIFTYYYFSFYSKNVFSEEVSGRKDIVGTSFGRKLLYEISTGAIIPTELEKKDVAKYANTDLYQTRYPGVQLTKDAKGNDIYTVEIIIPKPLFESDDHQQLFEEKMNIFFSTRIPTEDKRSMVVAKVVDYMGAAYRNTVVVPQLVHELAGSDEDGDVLYSHTYASYNDFNGKPHIYGDYANHIKFYGSTLSQAKFAEYISFMTKDKAVKMLLDIEKEKVEKNPNLPKELSNVEEELNLPVSTNDKENLVAIIEEHKQIKILLNDERLLRKKMHDIAFNEFVNIADANKENDQPNYSLQGEKSREWRDSKNAKKLADEELQKINIRIDNLKKEVERIDNLITLIATINILKLKDLPVTQSQLTNYLKKNANPVIPILQNKILETKIKILGNEKIFIGMYIKESSSTKKYEDFAKDIGASVKDVIEAHSSYSVQGDVSANTLNRATKDGVNVTASYGKFLAFAIKNELVLESNLFYVKVKDAEGKVVSIKKAINFINEDITSVRETGSILSMFLDGVKNPISSVLNLNETTASVTLSMIATGVPERTATYINKIPIIEKITLESGQATSSVQTGTSQYIQRSFISIADEYISKFKKKLLDTNRITELYVLDKKGNIAYDKNSNPMLRLVTITETDVNKEFTNKTNKTVKDLGITLEYYNKDSNAVADDIAEYYMLEKWLAVNKMNADVLKIGSVLNLIKKLKPSYEVVDNIFAAVSYLINGKSHFANIKEVLLISPEYVPLIKALSQLEKNSREIQIERNPIIHTIGQTLKESLNTYEMRQTHNKEEVVEQMIRFILINKFRDETSIALAEYQKDPKKNALRIQNLENAMKFFTADYWINNDFKQDLFYLADTHKGNAFVEFIKVATKDGIDIIESISRMKLDADITEGIINGFQALEKSSDMKARFIANKLFFHCVVKDGMSYSNNSFIKYVDPNLEQFENMSRYLDQFQQVLNSSNKQINAIRKSGLADEVKRRRIELELNNVFTNYFAEGNKTLGEFTTNMITKIGTYTDNSAMRVKTKTFNDTVQLAGKKLSVEDQKLIKETIQKLFPLNYEAIDNFKNRVNDANYSTFEGSKLDLFIPNSIFNKGIDHIVIDTTKTKVDEPWVIELLAQVGIQFHDGYEFPLYITNKYGHVFELIEVDQKSTQDQIKENTINYILKPSAVSFKLRGKIARYNMVENSGTSSIMNIGFNKEDGEKLYKYSQEVIAEQQKLVIKSTPVNQRDENINDDSYNERESQRDSYGNDNFDEFNNQNNNQSDNEEDDNWTSDVNLDDYDDNGDLITQSSPAEPEEIGITDAQSIYAKFPAYTAIGSQTRYGYYQQESATLVPGSVEDMKAFTEFIAAGDERARITYNEKAKKEGKPLFPAPTKSVVENNQVVESGYNFKGYNAEFDKRGKGTTEGDGKDKGMRSVADGFIGEVKKKDSSSYTSAKEISKKTENDINWDEEKTGTIFGGSDMAKITMLARNSEFAGKALSEVTKNAILTMKNQGGEFVVGDMPNVDSQFIDYLKQIGATFTIYHTGNKGTQRISVEKSINLRSCK